MMRMNNQRSLDTRKQIFLLNFRNFWRSREISSAILAELGTGASEWFTASWKEQLALKELDPTWEFLAPPFPFVINEDGTVELTPEEEITE